MLALDEGLAEAEAADCDRGDPWNVLLDAFEAQVRLLLDNGLEPQVRARLGRLLVAPGSLLAPGDSPAGSRPPGVSAGERSGAQEESPGATQIDPLVLAQVLTVARMLGRFKLTEEQHAALGLLRAWLTGRMKEARPCRD